MKLLASAGSKEELEKLINEYWCSENFIIQEDKPFHTKTNRYMDNYRAYCKKGRWRFEKIAN